MLDCPSDLRLTLFLEGQLSEKDALYIRLHATRCTECVRTVAAGLALQDLEAAGKLSPVSAQETAAAARRLRRLIDNMKVRLSDEFSSPQTPKPGVGARIKNLFSGFVIATGLSNWREALEHVAHVRALAQKNYSDDAVRNGGFPASQSATDIQENGNEKASNVTGPTASPLQYHAPTSAERPVVDEQSSWSWQKDQDASAVLCQALILRDFGAGVSEEDLRCESVNLNWNPANAGSLSSAFGNLLERHGVAVNRYGGATIDNLARELAQGHKVIVRLGLDEGWPAGWPDRFEDALSKTDALLICEIDTSDPIEPHVKLIDPVLGEAVRSYPLESFIEVWKDIRCFMVATTEPAPLALNPGMVNFDYALGHLPVVASLSYEDFQRRFLSDSEYDRGNVSAGSPTGGTTPTTTHDYVPEKWMDLTPDFAQNSEENGTAPQLPPDSLTPCSEYWHSFEAEPWAIPDDPTAQRNESDNLPDGSSQ